MSTSDSPSDQAANNHNDGPTLPAELVARLRGEFPALARMVDGQPAVFFDGPAGTQTPQAVIDAVSNCLAGTNANHGGLFA
ncbi:MAG: hypothetical protein KDA41_22660, partial [Planctomycetales bacterium]|nr:hypothetical protein [Planctomycetales bacterium]